MNLRAAELRDLLGLVAHPEGGWYREIFRSTSIVSSNDGRTARSAMTVIDFLLTSGEHSAWHVVSSDECWQFCEGDPLELMTFDPASHAKRQMVLGPVSRERRSSDVIPAGVWQAARTTGEYTLVQCTVSPGFAFEDFRLIRESELDRRVVEAELADWTRYL